MKLLIFFHYLWFLFFLIILHFVSVEHHAFQFEVFCSPIWHFLDSEAAQRQSMWRASKFVFPSAENERKRFSWLGLSSTETEIVRRALKVCFSQQMRVCILRLQRQSYSIACCWLNQLTHLTLGKARNQKKAEEIPHQSILTPQHMMPPQNQKAGPQYNVDFRIAAFRGTARVSMWCFWKFIIF